MRIAVGGCSLRLHCLDSLYACTLTHFHLVSQYLIDNFNWAKLMLFNYVALIPLLWDQVHLSGLGEPVSLLRFYSGLSLTVPNTVIYVSPSRIHFLPLCLQS